jgi:hypothetical protein
MYFYPFPWSSYFMKENHEDYCCPITSELFFDPVVAADGETYEREAIEQHIEYCQQQNKAVTSPLHNEKLENTTVIPNRRMKSQVSAFLDKNPESRKEQYLSETLKKKVREAVEKEDLKGINELLSKDERLLSTSLDKGDDGKNLLWYSCGQNNLAVLKNTLDLLTKERARNNFPLSV